MGTPTKTRWWRWLAWSLLLAVGLVVAMQQYEVWAQHRAVARIREIGGSADLDNSGIEPRFLTRFVTPKVRCVWLKETHATPADFRYLAKLNQIERLDLTGTRMGAEELHQLASLKDLQTLNLSHTNVDNSALQCLRFFPKIKTLSLANTEIGDEGIKHLAHLTQLQNLDITFCSLTGTGLTTLKSLPLLRTLELDDQQVTSDSVPHLQGLPLNRITVLVKEGNGRSQYDLLANSGIAEAAGVTVGSGATLWVNKKPWNLTLGGRCEIIQQQLNLNPTQAADFLKIVSKSKVNWNWDLPTGFSINQRQNAPVKGDPAAIQSLADFLAHSQANNPNAHENLRLFIGSERAKKLVPDLLQALSQTERSESNYPFIHYAATLLVRHGLRDPLVIKQLKAMLQDDPDWGVRGRTLYAFGNYFHFSRSQEEVPVPNADEVRTAVDLLLPVLIDEHSECRANAAATLSRIACEHSEFADIAARAILGQLQDPETNFWNYVTMHAWDELARAQPAAVQPHIETLRQAIKRAVDVEVTTNLIGALGSVGRVNKEAADDVTELYLSMLRNPEFRLNDAELSLQMGGRWVPPPGGFRTRLLGAAANAILQLAEDNPASIRPIVVELLHEHATNKNLRPTVEPFFSALVQRLTPTQRVP